MHPSSLPPLAAVSVWPRRTMRELLGQSPRPQALAIVIAAMVSFSLRDLDVHSLGEVAEALGLSASLLAALLMLTVITLVGIFMYYVLTAAATAAGRAILGGTGTYRDVRLAIAWGLAPQVWALFFRLPALILWPGAVAALRGGGRKVDLGWVQISPVLTGEVPLYQIAIIALGEVSILIWYLVVGSHTLAEAQGFSPLRGFANLMLAVVLPIAAILIIIMAILLTAWTGS